MRSIIYIVVTWPYLQLVKVAIALLNYGLGRKAMNEQLSPEVLKSLIAVCRFEAKCLRLEGGLDLDHGKLLSAWLKRLRAEAFDRRADKYRASLKKGIL